MICTETAPHTVVSVEVATQDNFSKSLEKNKIFRLHVVRGWIIDVEDRITTHGDPEEFHMSARARQINF